MRASGTVSSVFNSEKLAEKQSAELLKSIQSKLCLTPEQVKRWSGQRYLVLAEVSQVCPVTPFVIDRSEYGNMDDWLLVENIERVRK